MVIVYVGTVTDLGAEGIGVFHLDPEDGALSLIETVPVENPTWVALHPNGQVVYAAIRTGTGLGLADRAGSASETNAVAAFNVSADGMLSPLNQQPSHGASPCHVSIHPSGRCAFVANYGSGHIAAYPLAEDGSLSEAISVFHHAGVGPTAERQASAHAHFITPDPSGARVLACDLGVDRVFVYRVESATGRLTPDDLPYAQLSSGAGPRHLAFHPNGKFVYVIAELASTLSAFAYDAERGALQIVDTRSSLPGDFAGLSACAQVLVHPNGRFVYGSNRGHDSIAIFEIDQHTGRLTPRGHVPSGGRTPRNFNIHPDGRLLLAANQDSHTIVAFHVDAASGELTPTGRVTQTPAPVCIVFGQNDR